MARDLTSAQVADQLGVSIRTVQDWRTDGIGPVFYRTGRGGPKCPVRYTQAAVDAFKAKTPVPA